MVEGEMVLHLDDMLRRRSYIGMLDTSQAVAAADSAAKALASRLGWNEDQVAHEVRTFSQPRVDELATARAVSSSSRSRAS